MENLDSTKDTTTLQADDTLSEYITGQLTPYINDKVLEFMTERGGWVAGGALTSILSRTAIKDVDIYLPTKEDIYSFIMEFSERGHILHYSDKSVTFKVEGSVGRDALPYHQLITLRGHTSHEDIFNCFDFTINMVSWEPKTGKVEIHPQAMQHIAQRYLDFNENTLYPFISLLRVEKYTERGYKATKPTMMKIAMACGEKGIGNWEEFREQMGGLYGEELDLEEYEDKPYSASVAMEFLSGTKQVFKPYKSPLASCNLNRYLLAVEQSGVKPKAIYSECKTRLFVLPPLESEKEGNIYQHSSVLKLQECGGYKEDGCEINPIMEESFGIEEGSFKSVYLKPWLFTVNDKRKVIDSSNYSHPGKYSYERYYPITPPEKKTTRNLGLLRYKEEDITSVAKLFSDDEVSCRGVTGERWCCDTEEDNIRNGLYLPEIAYFEYAE